MQDMLSDLLACARFEAHTQVLSAENLKVREIVDQVLSRLKYQISAKAISVTTRGLDIECVADRKSLAQIFMNLVGNAATYIGSGPDRKIEISYTRNNGVFTFCIIDNGIGIPEKDRDIVFTKFKRGSNAAGMSGTGIGLAIVKAAVEAHNGKIWFESEEGKGTSFFFTIPEIKDTREMKAFK